jgi:putative ABC transport system permease protein
VCIEVALAVMLLGSAGLMGKSLIRVLSSDPGFRPEGLVGVELSLPDRRVEGGAPMVALQAQVLETVQAVPGVSAAARIQRLPGTGSGGTQSFLRMDQPPPPGAEPDATYREVSPAYFRTLGVPLLGGRNFGPEDRRESAGGLVNRALQQRYRARTWWVRRYAASIPPTRR